MQRPSSHFFLEDGGGSGGVRGGTYPSCKGRGDAGGGVLGGEYPSLAIPGFPFSFPRLLGIINPFWKVRAAAAAAACGEGHNHYAAGSVEPYLQTSTCATTSWLARKLVGV
jgi:hypothetical protein